VKQEEDKQNSTRDQTKLFWQRRKIFYTSQQKCGSQNGTARLWDGKEIWETWEAAYEGMAYSFKSQMQEGVRTGRKGFLIGTAASFDGTFRRASDKASSNDIRRNAAVKNSIRFGDGFEITQNDLTTCLPIFLILTKQSFKIGKRRRKKGLSGFKELCRNEINLNTGKLQSTAVDDLITDGCWRNWLLIRYASGFAVLLMPFWASENVIFINSYFIYLRLGLLIRTATRSSARHSLSTRSVVLLSSLACVLFYLIIKFSLCIVLFPVI